MPNKSPTNQVIGYTFLLSGFLGILLIGCGIGLLICILTVPDYTGLGHFIALLLAIPALAFGFMLTYFLVPLALRQLQWHYQIIILPALIIGLVPIGLGVQKSLDVFATSPQEPTATLERILTREKKNLEQFQKNAYVPVEVTCDIQEVIPDNDIKVIQAQLINLTRENVIKPLGHTIELWDEVKAFGNDRRRTFFSAKITKEAYDLLKKNIHVKAIVVDDIAIALMSNSIVSLQVNYASPDYARKKQQLGKEEAIRQNTKFALEHIINTLDAKDLTEYIFSQSYPDYIFYIKVNKNGYEQLEKNEYVTSMVLANGS